MKRLAVLMAFLPLFIGCASVKNVPAEGDFEAPRDLGFENVSEDSQTYAVSQVRPDKTSSSYTDIWSYIRGRVPGVMVGPSSAGSTPSIVIRGIGTNSNNTQPLFIVDGITMEDVSSLNPNEIDSVEVLKDGSAAMYGVQGANGVIIFRTKTAAAAARQAAEAARAEREAAREAKKESKRK